MKNGSKPGAVKSTVFNTPRTAAEDPSFPSAVEMPFGDHKKALEPHTFRPPATSNACGFGHGPNQKQGSMRVSGRSDAHRIGKR
jgi:hypothetical protein